MLVKNSKAIGLILIVFLSIPVTAFLLSHFAIQPVYAADLYVVTYLEPANITGLNIGDTFNITVLIKDFTAIYGWQAGLQWNASLLDAENVTFGKISWPESIFAVLAPFRSSNPMPGTIDNVVGQIYPPYAEGLTGVGGVNGTTGTGYKLMRVAFRVKDYAPEGSYIDFNMSDPYGPVTCWAQYPDVSTLLYPNATVNAAFYTIAPAAPTTPVASFTWTPTDPVPYQNATFDASSSLPGYDGNSTRPITEYRWDFNDDGLFEENTTSATIVHSFDDPITYPVTLEVYAPGSYPPSMPDTNSTTESVTVVNPLPTPTSPTLIFVDPPYINTTTVGQTFNVTVKIQDFIQLYSWQAGVKWDQQVLNCTSVMAGSDIDDSVFKVLAPGRFTLYMGPTINNTEGRLFPPAGETLTYPGEGVTGAAGVSYNLMKLTFQTIGTGLSDFHLFETATYYYPSFSGQTEGQNLIRDAYNVQLAEGDFTVKILTNSTGLYSDIGEHTFKGPSTNEISFVVTATSFRNSSYLVGNTNGFINITIPKSLIWVDSLSDWVVLVNGTPPIVTDTSQNSTHYLIYFAYPHRTDGDNTAPYPHTVVIRATHSIPEYPSTLLLTILLLGASIAVLLRKAPMKRLKQKSHYYPSAN
jgi:hypothetical protein